MPKPCKECGSLNHSRFSCPKRPRSPLKTTVQLKPKRRLRKLGKIGKALQQQRKDYLADIPPPYYCIYCIFMEWNMPPLDVEAVNVEHTNSKTHHPELRFVQGNLAISCPFHNELKSSKDIDEFLEILKKLKEAYGQTKPDSTY